MARAQYIVIVGCGRLGSILANQLSSQGNSVVVIDQHESAFKNLSAEFSGFQIAGDAAELAVLRRAKLEKAECLLAATDQDNINLMVAQVAKIMFKVPIVVARLFNPAREKVYQEFGISTICPTGLSAAAFVQALEIQANQLHS